MCIRDRSEWAVWYDLFFPQLDQQIIGEEHRAYFTSDLRLGPQGYQKLLALDRQELKRRAKMNIPVSYTHLRAHETVLDLVCRLLLEKNKT